jgi:hypothetical protein
MGLFARLTAADATKISVHAFSSALRLYAASSITRANVIDAFTLAGADITDLDAIAASYAALPSATVAGALQRMNRLHAIESVFILCESGLLTENQAKTILGF